MCQLAQASKKKLHRFTLLQKGRLLQTIASGRGLLTTYFLYNTHSSLEFRLLQSRSRSKR